MPSKREELRLMVSSVSVTRTFIPSLDYILGRGGLPQGRTVVFFGPESAGKTLLSLQCIRAFQRQGKQCAFIDVEAALDGDLVKKMHVDAKQMEYFVPRDANELIKITEELAEDESVGLIVIDSITSAKVVDTAADWTIGQLSRFASRLLPSVASLLYRSGNTLLLISQVRNVIGYQTHAEPTGGFAVRHYPSVMVQLKPSRRDVMFRDDQLVAYKLTMQCVKNKCAPPGRSAETWVHLDEPFGIRYAEDVVRMALTLKLISPFSKTYRDVKLAEKKDQIDVMVARIKEHDLLKPLTDELYEIIAPKRREEDEDLPSSAEQSVEASARDNGGES